MKTHVLLALALFALILPGPLAAGTIYVDDDGPNDPGPGDPAVSDPLEDGSEAHPFDAIQEGIDAATDGDTVLVRDGTYTGDGNRDLDFGGKALTLRSANGPAVCIIDCEGARRGFVFRSRETADSVVDGFTITNGYTSFDGGAIYCRYSSPTITTCTITGNSAVYCGGGIYSRYSSPSISNCTIKGNLARDGGGIYCSSSSPTITNCMITGNTASDDSGGIYCSYFSSPTIANCTIVGNVAEQYGGGIACRYESSPVMTGCILWGNNASVGREISVRSEAYPSTLRLQYCDVEGGAAAAHVAPGCTLDCDASNIEADPLVRPDGHLQSGSPCIDWCPDGATDDIDGEARPFDVIGFGFDGERLFDIGADEFVDTDGDGLPDWWELAHFGSPTAARPGRDPDHDGAGNLTEYKHALDPLDADTDDDGRRDGWELQHGTNPHHPDNRKKTYYVNGTTGDDARDGLAPSYDGAHGPKRTIQAGIDAAVTGWGYTVLVAEGTYTGTRNKDLDFGGKAITVRSENGPDVTIIDCEGSGRGFNFHSGETAASIVDGLTISNGSASNGGGIYSATSDPTIRNCAITGNWADDDGGGIYLWESSPAISSCTIADNAAWDEGGGIYCGHDSHPTITDCTVTGNSARTYHGGGVKCVNWAAPKIMNCVIAHNEAFGRGGGIHGDIHSAPTITDCTISDNSAGTYGGGVCCAGNPSLARCTIERNTAEQGGGAYLYDDGSPSVVSCTIAGNAAERDGGGVVCGRWTEPTLRDCTITGNSAIWYGGGVYCRYGGSPTIIGCRIQDNSVVWDGGGVFCETSTNTTINACVIAGNRSRKWAGAIECLDSSPLITNCLIVSNVADEFAGAISCWGDRFTSDPTITNCTIAGNCAGIYAGAIVCAGDSSATVTNCILWGNGPGEILVDEDATPSFTYCDVQGGWAGMGNISVNPLFVPGPLHDYYLSQTAAGQGADSPCVDAGSDTAVALGLDVLTTRQDGGRDTGIVDIGYHAPPPPVTIHVDDDGPSDPGPGDPAVSDPLEDGSADHPYDAIQEGIDAAIDGDTVLVRDGTYTGDGNRDLDFHGKAITLRSEDGPDVTIIDCQGTAHEQHRGLVFHSGETAASVVDGFTIRRGWESEGGAIHCRSGSSPLIANCVLMLNRAWGGGAVACTRGSSATIVGCTLVGNSATYGGGIYCDASAPSIRDCAVKENEAVYGGGIACWYGSDAAIRDSMIVQNEALSGGGGIYCCYDSNAAITNCAITDNWTGDYGGGLCCFESSAALMNCALASNTADTDGGALACYKGTFTFANCILWGNSPREIQYNQADVTVTYCDVRDGTGEPWFDPVTCIDADPLFVDPENGDYRLQLGSACIDAGTSDGAPERDIQGAPRWDERTIPNTGGGDKPWYDMGAYEFYRGRRLGQLEPHPGKGPKDGQGSQGQGDGHPK